MIRAFFLSVVVFFSLLHAEAIYDDINQTSQNYVKIKQKVLYISLEKIPKRVIVGEIFPITVRVLNLIKDSKVDYSFSDYSGLEILNNGVAFEEQKDKYFYETFYFKAISTKIKLPTITAKISFDQNDIYKSSSLKLEDIDVIKLNPKSDFSNIIANDFNIKKYKTSNYDNMHNIVVFSAESKNGFLDTFHLNNVAKQGFESIEDDINISKMIYFCVINKKIENLRFSYFNLLTNSYITLNIPIIVQDDTVTTQSDLKPKDQSKDKIKILIALLVALGFLFLFILKRKLIYIVFISIPIIYIAYMLKPNNVICIKKSSPIRILPLENGTVFEITKQKIRVEEIGRTKGFFKIEINNKIGWVKDEDTCHD